jgi:hypothetical protein
MVRKVLNDERLNSRFYLLSRKTKLWWATHQSVSPVVDFRPLAKEAVLACGCSRAVEFASVQTTPEVANVPAG